MTSTRSSAARARLQTNDGLRYDPNIRRLGRMQPQNQTLSYVLTGAVVVLVFGLRFWRMRRSAAVPRRLRLEYMWIMPAVIVLASVALLVQAPPYGLDWHWLSLIRPPCCPPAPRRPR